MQIAMVGLGRMGANIVRRLMRDGHDCVVYDVNPDSVAALVAEGAVGASDLADPVSQLDISDAAKQRLLTLTPATYTGIASELVDLI